MTARTLFITVGERMEPIYEGFKRIKDIEEVYYIVSDKTKEYAQRLVKEFSNLYKSYIVEVDPRNLDKSIDKIIETQKKLKEDIVYNLSGGTKVMILACYIIACFKSQKAFYIFKKNDGGMEYVEVPILKFDLKNIVNKENRAYRILNLLKDTSLQVTELAEKMKLKKSTISGHIDKLENELGFVEREPINRKSSKLRLTKTGEITLSIIGE
jgi:CRISPR locus-related DNA-binding protein